MKTTIKKETAVCISVLILGLSCFVLWLAQEANGVFTALGMFGFVYGAILLILTLKNHGGYKLFKVRRRKRKPAAKQTQKGNS